MKLFVATLGYVVEMPEVEKHTPDHRAYLKTLFDRGALVASGPFVPRNGGMLLLRAESRDEVDLMLADDPFLDRGIVRYAVREWAPSIGGETFDPSR